jgi:hypothetical protein
MGPISDDTRHHAVPKRLTVLEGVQMVTTTEFINYSGYFLLTVAIFETATELRPRLISQLTVVVEVF